MKEYKGILCCLLSALYLCGCGKASLDENRSGSEPPVREPQMAETSKQETDFTEYKINLTGSFQGIYGCAVFLNPQERRYDLYNEVMGKEEASAYEIVKNIYGEQDTAALKSMLLADDNGTRKIYGKTGSQQDCGAWFAGFSEEDGGREYFAVCLNDETHKEQVSEEKAIEITLDIFDSRKEFADEADDAEKYRAFVKKNHTAGIANTLLADLTGDEREELIVLDNQESGKYIPVAVYGIRDDGQVVRLYEDAAYDAHPGWRWLYLYEEDGKNYLFRYSPVMYQGIGTYSYEIFSLTGEGGEVLLASEEKAYDISRGEVSEELWDEMGKFLEPVHAYQNASIPLVEIGEDYVDAAYGSFEARKYNYVIDRDELGLR